MGNFVSNLETFLQIFPDQEKLVTLLCLLVQPAVLAMAANRVEFQPHFKKVKRALPLQHGT